MRVKKKYKNPGNYKEEEKKKPNCQSPVSETNYSKRTTVHFSFVNT